jgi:hypothetical protein
LGIAYVSWVGAEKWEMIFGLYHLSLYDICPVWTSRDQGFIVFGGLLTVNPDFGRRDSKQALVVTKNSRFSPSKAVQVDKSAPGHAAKR